MRSSFIKRTMASIVLALVVILAFSPVPLEASLHADGGWIMLLPLCQADFPSR